MGASHSQAEPAPEVRVGTSGFQYDHWRGAFYPARLARRHWFDYYAERFRTVEINSTFYGLPSAETVARWRQQAPPDFRYSVKFSRYGSHVRRLREPEAFVEKFWARLSLLGEYLGPVLVQLPPHWRVDLPRLKAFLHVLPPGAQWTVEFRDSSWFCKEVFDLLCGLGVGLCIHDMLPRHPQVLTAAWTYLRYHGDHYSGSYSHQYLVAQARRIRRLVGEGVSVYAYFNNDQAGYAAVNALSLQRYLASA